MFAIFHSVRDLYLFGKVSLRLSERASASNNLPPPLSSEGGMTPR